MSFLPECILFDGTDLIFHKSYGLNGHWPNNIVFQDLQASLNDFQMCDSWYWKICNYKNESGNLVTTSKLIFVTNPYYYSKNLHTLGTI